MPIMTKKKNFNRERYLLYLICLIKEKSNHSTKFVLFCFISYFSEREREKKNLFFLNIGCKQIFFFRKSFNSKRW